MNKSNTNLIIIIVVFVLIAGGLFFVINIKNQNIPIQNKNIVPSNLNKAINIYQNLNLSDANVNKVGDNWITYNDPRGNYRIIYPTDWIFDKDFSITNQGEVLENLPLLTIGTSTQLAGKSYEGYKIIEETDSSVSGSQATTKLLKADFNSPPGWYEAEDFEQVKNKYIFNTTFDNSGVYYDIQFDFKESEEKGIDDYKNDYNDFLSNFLLI